MSADGLMDAEFICRFFSKGAGAYDLLLWSCKLFKAQAGRAVEFSYCSFNNH